ncbi:MAG TPA: ATP-binding protein [Mycobacteriales bacterium]|jgi:serine/threonine-protein kinase RsbW|nr:ATP-binding protein [Mycobacteriales bacterium]
MSDQVVLRLPAESAYLSVLRTATASLASRLDFTLDDIEDLRIAVDEACALLLPHALEGSSLECAFDLSPDALAVTVSVPTSEPVPIAQDSFAWTVLTALVGDVTSKETDDGVMLSLVKRRVSTS